MKLDARQIAGFLRDPGKCRLVLLHGDDEGLIRERAQQLTRGVAGSLNDPFRVAELDRDGWSRIAGEMAAISMMGGRRAIRLRDVTDAILAPLQAAMKGPGDALLILEAPGLGRGKLRNFAEAAQDAAAIACYPEEGRALQELLRGALAELHVTAEPDALAWLVEVLGGDRSVVRGEAEKLALLAGEGGRVDLDMARNCIGDGAGAAGEDAMLVATCGRVEAADAAIDTAMQEGLNGVALMRMALMHLQKLHQARLRMDQGASAGEAMRAMRPPVFYRAAEAMTASLARWPTASLSRAINEARTVELACKQTGSRPELLARAFVASLARRGARAR